MTALLLVVVSRSEPKTQHDDKFALHWNMEIDHKFTYSQSWLSSSDQEMITYSLKSIRVHFDVPDVKAVGKYEVQDASKEIPGRNIKVLYCIDKVLYFYRLSSLM